jgi:hypothetical protein
MDTGWGEFIGDRNRTGVACLLLVERTEANANFDCITYVRVIPGLGVRVTFSSSDHFCDVRPILSVEWVEGCSCRFQHGRDATCEGGTTYIVAGSVGVRG